MRLACALLVAAALCADVAAQAPGTLVVEVVDSVGGFLPGAVVVLRNGTAVVAEMPTNASGLASFSVPPGTYNLSVHVDSFAPYSGRLQVTAGRQARRTVELALSSLSETITVTAGDGSPTDTAIGEDEINALADDPDALNDFIRDVGGPEAEVTIDGFEGGRMPPKEQVAQVIVTSDPYSAQFHGVGQNRVNVITRPGFGEWRRAVNLNFGNEALSARNPFAREKLPYQSTNGYFSASGPIPRLRTSLSLDGNVRRRTELYPTIAIGADGGLTRTESPQRDDRYSFEIRVTNAIGKSTILRNQIEVESSDRIGAGLGDLDLPERAYNSGSRRVSYRGSLTSQLGRVSQNIRFSAARQINEQRSLTEAQTLDVLGAFRSGGAQNTGTSRALDVNLEGEWHLPQAGRHRIVTGTMLELNGRHSSNIRNYLGTFVFAGIDAYREGRPITYTQRVGSQDLSIQDHRAGLFVQDDIRLNSVLSLGLGVRQEWQPAIDDAMNIAPRLSVSYVTKARTTLRVGLGAFYTWHDTSLLEEAQRLDGERFYEIVIQQPGYPDPFSGGTTQASAPPTRLITADDLILARSWRASLTFERRIGVFNVRATVNRQIGHDEPRSRNINVPVDGIRPDLTRGNVLLLASTGRSRRTGLDLNLNAGNLWRRRLFTSLQYSSGESLNDADGALSLPVDNLRPDLEWGPSRGDVRHRAWGTVNLRMPRAFNASVSVRWQSGSPYNITTGTDTNGDTVSNDRPAGVGRNSARGFSNWASDLRAGWTRPLGGVPPQRPGQGPNNQGPEAGVTLAAYNVLNRTQYGSFNGVVTSPLFGQPTSAFGPRRIDLSLHLRF